MGTEVLSVPPHVSRQGFLSQMGVVHHPKWGRLSGLACYRVVLFCFDEKFYRKLFKVLASINLARMLGVKKLTRQWGYLSSYLPPIHLFICLINLSIIYLSTYILNYLSVIYVSIRVYLSVYLSTYLPSMCFYPSIYNQSAIHSSIHSSIHPYIIRPSSTIHSSIHLSIVISLFNVKTPTLGSLG